MRLWTEIGTLDNASAKCRDLDSDSKGNISLLF